MSEYPDRPSLKFKFNVKRTLTPIFNQPKQVTTKYGERFVLAVNTEDGAEASWWMSGKCRDIFAHNNLKKGDTIDVVKLEIEVEGEKNKTDWQMFKDGVELFPDPASVSAPASGPTEPSAAAAPKKEKKAVKTARKRPSFPIHIYDLFSNEEKLDWLVDVHEGIRVRILERRGFSGKLDPQETDEVARSTATVFIQSQKDFIRHLMSPTDFEDLIAEKLIEAATTKNDVELLKNLWWDYEEVIMGLRPESRKAVIEAVHARGKELEGSE